MEFVNDDDMRKETGGVYIPFSIYQDMFGRANAISYMLAKAIEPEKSVDAEDEANAVFARSHNGIHDVKIENMGKEILKERGNVQTVLHNWRIVFFSIAGVSLLIGRRRDLLGAQDLDRRALVRDRPAQGDGRERRRGLHAVPDRVGDAVGGRRSHRLRGGVGLVRLIAKFFPAGLPVSLFGTTVSIGFAISIGLIAGLYPSISASRLEPVEALRA